MTGQVLGYERPLQNAREVAGPSDSLSKYAHPRILHVTEALGGGVATALEQYMSYEGATHHLLAVIRPEVHPPELLRNLGDRATLVSDRAALIKCWARLRKSHDFDIVHLHSTVAGILGRAVPARARVVYSPHALGYLGRGSFSPRQLARVFESILARRSSSFGAVSWHEKRELLGLGVPDQDVVVVPHALRPRVTERRTLQPGGTLTIAGFGRLSYQKDPETFLQIAQAAKAHGGTQQQWVWIGDGDSRARDRLRQAGVEVTGWLSRERALSVLGQADVLLHTARYEGMPFSVLEAMSFGIPVVARSIAPIRELAGVLTFEQCREALDLIVRLKDPAFYSRLSTASLRTVEDSFSFKKQEDALQELWKTDV